MSDYNGYGKTEINDSFINAIEKALTDTAIPLIEVPYGPKNYAEIFRHGFIESPIESIKMGGNQFIKFATADRDFTMGATYETLTNPSLICEIITDDKKTSTKKPIHIYAKSFVIQDTNNKKVIQSLVVMKTEGKFVSGAFPNDISEMLTKIKKTDEIIYANENIRRVATSLLRVTGSHEWEVTTSPTNPLYDTTKILSIKQLEKDGKITTGKLEITKDTFNEYYTYFIANTKYKNNSEKVVNDIIKYHVRPQNIDEIISLAKEYNYVGDNYKWNIHTKMKLHNIGIIEKSSNNISHNNKTDFRRYRKQTPEETLELQQAKDFVKTRIDKAGNSNRDERLLKYFREHQEKEVKVITMRNIQDITEILDIAEYSMDIDPDTGKLTLYDNQISEYDGEITPEAVMTKAYNLTEEWLMNDGIMQEDNVFVSRFRQFYENDEMYSLSLMQLYEENKKGKESDSGIIYLENGYIEKKVEDSEEYYDFYSSGKLVCMDGEVVKFAGYKKNNEMLFINANGEENIEFILTEEEFNAANAKARVKNNFVNINETYKKENLMENNEKNFSPAKIWSYEQAEIEGKLTYIETERRKGLDAFDIIGIHDINVTEARETVKKAMEKNGFPLPEGRLMITIEPIDKIKNGNYALAMALLIIGENGKIPEGTLVLGDLGPEGTLKDAKTQQQHCRPQSKKALEILSFRQKTKMRFQALISQKMQK